MTRASNKPRSGWLKRWILALNILLVIFLGLTYATPFVSVESWGWLSLLALTYPFMLLGNGLMVLGWTIVRSHLAWLSASIILLGLPFHVRYVKLFSFQDSGPECRESIRLVSYNMRGLSLVPVNKNAGVEGKIDSLYEALSELGEIPDILCLQEANNGERIARKFGLDHSLHAPKSTLWLLSRYPVIRQGVLDGEEINPSCMWADLKTPQGTLRVYNMHLVSNRITNTAEELINDMDLQNENTWSNIRFILSRYHRTTRKRAREAMAIRLHMDECPHPAVIAGDGNDTPLSHTYHLLSNDLRDSFRQAGSGRSTTYASKLPLLRIDYILGSRDIWFKDHETHHISYSDHYPVGVGICILPASGS